MALQEKYRNIVYQAWVPVLGEEATAAMLAHFPAREDEEPITRDHLDRRFVEHRAVVDRRFLELRADLERQITELRADLERQITEVRADLERQITQQIAELRAHLEGLITAARIEAAQQAAAIRVEVAQQNDKTFHRMLAIAAITVTAMSAVMTTLFAAFT